MNVWISKCLHRFWKFSAIISLYKLYTPFFSFWNFNYACCFVCWHLIIHSDYLHSFPFLCVFFFKFSSDWIISRFLSSKLRLFLLLDSVCCWCSLLNFLFHSLYSSTPEFVWFFFMTSISLLNFSFCFCIIFLILLNWLSVFLVAHWAYLKQLVWTFKKRSLLEYNCFIMVH